MASAFFFEGTLYRPRFTAAVQLSHQPVARHHLLDNFETSLHHVEKQSDLLR